MIISELDVVKVGQVLRQLSYQLHLVLGLVLGHALLSCNDRLEYQRFEVGRRLGHLDDRFTKLVVLLLTLAG